MPQKTTGRPKLLQPKNKTDHVLLTYIKYGVLKFVKSVVSLQALKINLLF